jgi:hypothetical protein
VLLNCSWHRIQRTEMTFLNPSSTSLSFRLSSNFLIWPAGIVFVVVRELRADCAASRVSSRATKRSASRCACGLHSKYYIPLSSKLDILDIDSISDHGIGELHRWLTTWWGLGVL